MRPDGIYVITGGMGGLGLELAHWLAEGGARHLVLVGRRATLDADTSARVEALRQQGVTVETARVDVTEAGDVERFFAELQRCESPVRGVFHAAALLEDRVLAEIDAEAAAMKEYIAGRT